MDKSIRLAQQLPPTLLRFFTKFPPPQIRAAAAAAPATTPTNPDTITITSNTSSSDPNVGAATSQVQLDTSPNATTSEAASKKFHNPFLPWKNPRTGAWHGPVYSLRRQADLFKLAREHHVLSLMPVSHKHPEVKEQKRIERGLRVQGTGVGKKVKGKLWERQLRGKLEDRRRAMEGMPEMIRLWKERGHGRGWKKFPK
jgi:large subunit ribosomal protein L25